MSPYLALAAALTLGLILGASLHALYLSRTRVQSLRSLPLADHIGLFGGVQWTDGMGNTGTYESLAFPGSIATLDPDEIDPDDEWSDWGEFPPPPLPHPSELTTLTRADIAALLRDASQ